MRAPFLEADPEITEWKWENPTWSRHGIICTGEAYKNVKLTLARGAAVPDPKGDVVPRT